MKRVGQVVQAAQGLAIVRVSDDPPSIGTDVIDEDLESVGQVVDVFGPVENPYVAISPDAERVAPLVGSTLYTRNGS